MFVYVHFYEYKQTLSEKGQYQKILEVDNKITIKELKTYINNHSLKTIIYKGIYNFLHLDFSDTHISLYNNESECEEIATNFQIKNNCAYNLNIPIDNITEINIEYINSRCSEIMLNLSPIGGMILSFDSIE